MKGKGAMTTMARKFTEAGLPPRDVEIMVALAKYRNLGGTKTRLLALVERAYELPDEDHVPFADKADRTIPSFRQPNGDGEGQTIHAADRGQRSGAPPSPDESGAGGGRSSPAEEGQPNGATPAREVTREQAAKAASILGRYAHKGPTEADLAAAARAAKRSGITIMETTFVRGRGPWATRALGELRAISIEGTRDAAIAKYLLANKKPGTPMTASVKEAFTESIFQRAIQNAACIVDTEVGYAAA